MRIQFVLVLMSLLLAAKTVEAARPTYSYLCIAKLAANVVVAEPISVSPSPAYSGIPFDYYSVRFRVKRNVKSVLEKQGRKAESIELLWPREDFHAARYSIGAEYLLFLGAGENGLYVINGSQGAQKLERGEWKIYGRSLSPAEIGKFVEIGERKATGCDDM